MTAAFRHDQPQRTAVLLVNLGTPAAPTQQAVRPYLREFLTDRRVIELPAWLWRVILELAILPRRPKVTAEKYASIWLPEGSPLAVYTARLAEKLQALWGKEGPMVRWAMRYGEPSVSATLRQLREQGLRRLLVVPLYPQYCASTTASVFDAVVRELMQWRDVPELRFVRHWHDHPRWTARLAHSIRTHWQTHGEPEMLLFSFHGMPKKTLLAGDPYHCECHKSARLIAEALALPNERYRVTFQSRFGPAEWLQPYTEPTLKELAQQGVKRVAVVCPGFVTDCLETLEEIAVEAKTAFLDAGGESFQYIPCLNDDPEWVADLAAILQPHLHGWPAVSPQDSGELAKRLERARALGAES